MNPDLEQRLRSGLGQEANALPDHGGSPETAVAAGRRRQATRRIGTGLAAVALLVGGNAIYAQNQPNDPVDVVVADDGRATVTSLVEDENEVGDAAGRDPVALAVGTQVIVVDANGEMDIRWSVPTGQRLVSAQAAGRNGVVIETLEEILWLPTGDRMATVLKTEDQNLFLHDVTRIDGQWSAIWSEAPIDWESEEFKGSSRLVAQNVQTGAETEIESYSWLGEGDDWKYYADATPLFPNGPMAIVRSYNQGACHWIDPIAPGGVMSAIATPLPRPEDPAQNCTNPIITDISRVPAAVVDGPWPTSPATSSMRTSSSTRPTATVTRSPTRSGICIRCSTSATVGSGGPNGHRWMTGASPWSSSRPT